MTTPADVDARIPLTARLLRGQWRTDVPSWIWPPYLDPRLPAGRSGLITHACNLAIAYLVLRLFRAFDLREALWLLAGLAFISAVVGARTWWAGHQCGVKCKVRDLHAEGRGLVWAEVAATALQVEKDHPEAAKALLAKIPSEYRPVLHRPGCTCDLCAQGGLGGMQNLMEFPKEGEAGEDEDPSHGGGDDDHLGAPPA